MKIAIINNWPHQFMGGVESYTRRLISIFKSLGWEVDEYSTLSTSELKATGNPIKGIMQYDISNNSKFYRKYANKYFDRLLEEDKYDIYITNTLVTKKSLKSRKVIAIQHMERDFYTIKSPDRWFSFLNALFLRIGSTKPIISHKNTVYFTKFENPKGLGNPLFTTTPLKDTFEIKSKKKIGKNIFWLGRHEEPHKGLKHLRKMFEGNELCGKLIIGGSGPDTKILNSLKNNMVGMLDAESVKKEFGRSKVFILTSNSEGFPLVIIEALASGVPVVMFDSFISAKYFKDTEVVKLVKPFNYKSFIKEVEDIMNMDDVDYLALSKRCSDFAREKFSKDNFKKRWIEYIESIANKDII